MKTLFRAKYCHYLPALIASFTFHGKIQGGPSGARTFNYEATNRFDPGSIIHKISARNNSSVNTPPRTSSPRIGQSDIGLQRPLAVKRRGLDYFIGFDTKVYYSSNPSIAERNSKFAFPAGVFQNNVHSGFRLGSYNWGNAAFSPYIGASLTRFDHFGEENLDTFDMNSLAIFGFGLIQFQNGWAIRAGINYSQDNNAVTGSRDYYDIYPNLTILKTFSLGKSLSLVDFAVGNHFTDATHHGSLNGAFDALDRWEFSSRWTVITFIGKLEISPYARIAFISYKNGDMNDRKDLMREVGIDLEYPFNKYISANLFARYVSRLSSGGLSSYDFERFDGGGGAALKAKF
tara:strand:- start:8 stop:1045 length:1038 start_codon:yes stop_codon:yes gene_type:complete